MDTKRILHAATLIKYLDTYLKRRSHHKVPNLFIPEFVSAYVVE